MDRDYYDYYRRGRDLFTNGGPLVHLTGAVGVSGSIVPLAADTITAA